jgi:hypothetical protein
MLMDANGNPIPVMGLTASQDVNGTAASVQSAAIAGNLVRIVATDADIRVLTGVNPTALATSIFIPSGGELWLPVVIGDKVAVLGGIANICTVFNVFEV